MQPVFIQRECSLHQLRIAQRGIDRFFGKVLGH